MTSGQLHIQNGTGPAPQTEMANSNQELLSKGGSRRWVVLVVLALLAGLAAAVAVVIRARTASEPAPLSFRLSGPQRGISLESFVAGKYSPTRFNGTWINDEEILYRAKNGSFISYNVKRNKSKILLHVYSNMPHESIIRRSFQYELSADGRYLLLAHGYQKLYRHTFLAYYHIVDLETKKSWPLADVNGSQMLLQLVVWSPVGNALAYVYVNDIYYRTSAREQPVQEYRLTHNGRPGTVYNGVPDWVYEEEILGSNKALWFSDDGRTLAFATFNDSQTPVMNIPYYGAPGDVRYQYTQAVNIRYPKPGRPNPMVSVNIIKLIELQYQKSGVTTFDIAASPGLKEPVLNLVKWTPTSELFVVWMNRVQNQAHAMLCSPENNKCRLIMQMEEKAGWVTLGEPLFSADGSRAALIRSTEQGGAGGFRHVMVIDLYRPGSRVALTTGRFVVSELLAWDPDSHFIYFLSPEEGSPGQMRLNRVSDRLTGAPHQHECLTCSSDPSLDCTYTSALFSKKNSFYVQSCSGPTIPRVTIHTKDGSKLFTWEANNELRSKLEGKELPTVEYLTVPIADGSMEAYVKLFFPPDMDTSGDTKYPMLVQVYAGPDSSQISERFGVDWYSYLTVNKSIIYAMIDGRGSGNKGDKMLFANYRSLGTKEVEDQIKVTQWLQNNKPFIDAHNTAIWGWSYGGYATGMALAADKVGVFKCGISVAPVSDWLLYDTLYTERFMGLPSMSDNLKGYETASLVNKVDNFRNKQYLLVHGTLDDNVHYQQSMMLAKALELKDILFEQQSYPDEGHGLSDVRPHLYHSLEHFLDKCFSTGN